MAHPQLRVLGEVRVEDGEVLRPVPPGKPAAVLTVLALDAGRAVATEALVDALWGERPPSSARALVHTYVSAVRRALADVGDDRMSIVTVPGGYRLDLPAGRVDALALLALAGREQADADDLAAGLALWRGPALVGLAEPFAAPWRARLQAAQALVRQRWWRARLPAEPATIVPELRAAVLEDPLDEEAVLLLGQALHATGRRDEAVAVLDGYRRNLVQELGMEPGDRFATVRTALVSASPPAAAGAAAPTRQSADPAPDQAQPAVLRPLPQLAAPPRLSRRTLLVTGAGTAAGVVISAVLARRVTTITTAAGGAPRSQRGPALMMLDAVGARAGAVVHLPVEPAQLALAGDAAWVASQRDQAIALVDLVQGEVIRVVGLPEPPTSIAAVNGTAVVGLGFSGRFLRASPDGTTAPEPAVPGMQGRLTLASDGQTTWVATMRGTVSRLGRSGRALRMAGAPHRMAVDLRRAWVITSDRRELVAVELRTGASTASGLRGRPVDVVADGGTAYVVTSADDRLWAASATSGRIIATRPLPGAPSAVTALDGTVWAALRSPATLLAYRGKSLDPTATIDLAAEPADLAMAPGRLVVALR